MGVSYRDYLQSRKRLGTRIGEAVDQKAAVQARALAIREQNRKKAAQKAQHQLRMMLWQDDEPGQTS